MSKLSSTIIAAMLASVAALPTSALAQTTPVPPESLRIATYNAYLLSPLFKCLAPTVLLIVPFADCLAQIEGQTEGWAHHLADEILADRENIDVIALNEIWDEDAKKILRRRLAASYPVQVTDIDMSLITIRAEVLADIPNEVSASLGVSVAGEDSGLMLFAKKDFQVLPLPNPVFKWGGNQGETLDATTDQVAFRFYKACGAEDCLAAKGAAMIRLRHGGEGPVYNIVWTHMQADYPGDGHRDVRDRQFADVKRLIEKTLDPLAPHVRGREVVLLMGDLNVPLLQSNSEWTARFGNASSFFRAPLFETFAHTSSTKDKTETNGNDHERLDYILASPLPVPPTSAPSRQRCVQHVTVPVNFRDLESDHNMVRADINQGGPHCNPASAVQVALNAQGSAEIDFIGGQNVTRIANGGAMQWFEVKNEDTATWSIGTDTLQVPIEIYLPEDLTTPVSRYNATPGTPRPSIRRSFALDQYVLPKHFFIRARGNLRTTTSDYGLQIIRHNCSSKAVACILQPGDEAQVVELSGDTLAAGQLSFQDEAWYRFHAVGTATSGNPQTITLTASLNDETRVTSQIQSYSDPLGGTLSEAAMTNIRGYSGKVGDGGNGYLVIKQASRAATPTSVRAVLDSNIRFLRVKSLVCRDETNPEAGSDDIFTRWTIDGVTKRAPSSGDVEFDCDANDDPKNWLSRMGGPEIKPFLEGFAMRLIEDDDTSGNDEAMRKEVEPLSNGQLKREDGRLLWIFDDGKYEFHYDLYRRMNGPVGDL